jgi:hypothetical protein
MRLKPNRITILSLCFCTALLIGLALGNDLFPSLPAISSPSISSKPTAQSTVQSTVQSNIQSTVQSDTTAQTPNHLAQTTPTYQTIDEQKRNGFRVDSREVLSAGTLPNISVQFNANDLLTVLNNTRTYFKAYSAANPDTQRAGILGAQGVTVADIQDTLDFMITTLQEDLAERRPIRLQDPNFIKANFRVIRWTAYNPSDLQEREVRLTKYAVFEHPGSRTRTATYNVPLYQLGADAESDRFYLNYTKQEVLSGIYEPGGREAGRVQPLAYLTRESFEDAIMQGTVLLNYTDGTSAFFNVDRNNGIAYVRGVSPYQQGRYWYFKSVDGIKGYGHVSESKITIKPGVTFAGDVLNLGLGRIVVLEHSTGGRQQLMMGVVADTGGAFIPNLHQLDFLAGVFRNRDEFNAAISGLPEYAKAYLLVRAK